MKLSWILIPKNIFGRLLAYFYRRLNLEDFEILVLWSSQIRLRFVFWKFLIMIFFEFLIIAFYFVYVVKLSDRVFVSNEKLRSTFVGLFPR